MKWIVGFSRRKPRFRRMGSSGSSARSAFSAMLSRVMRRWGRSARSRARTAPSSSDGSGRLATTSPSKSSLMRPRRFVLRSKRTVPPVLLEVEVAVALLLGALGAPGLELPRLAQREGARPGVPQRPSLAPRRGVPPSAAPSSPARRTDAGCARTRPGRAGCPSRCARSCRRTSRRGTPSGSRSSDPRIPLEVGEQPREDAAAAIVARHQRAARLVGPQQLRPSAIRPVEVGLKPATRSPSTAANRIASSRWKGCS